ncbi:PQQ-binding-like beta-propeller repeat protein [Maribellus maritimus]|uniref:PQQ-binding-like beta-propeller repeat protein n=1 Tax=Maribellus maritimus TaxID=2870838 RepID=UPI001EEAA082|nr:PQQ-binding-like beta-propeller repeat protein [Maribellus maritimus]MCG6186562.1 PQQ-like beta-propeller repeat protein [Maribellus maritimus]
MKQLTLLSTVFLVFLFVSCNETAQWGGPTRDGIFPDTGLLKTWPPDGPPLKLKIEDIGKGLSQPVVYKDVIYVTGLRSDTLDVIGAYNMEGKLLWEKEYSRAWPRAYPESRGTPTIEKNRIYLVGGMGKLVCLSTRGGKVIWEKQPLSEFNGKYMYWGNVESVLLTDDAALYVTGGEQTTLVAYDKKTGKLRWKSKSTGGDKSYASASLVEWGGKKIVLVQTSDDLVGFDASNGNVLWTYNTVQYHTEKGSGEAANIPLFSNGDIFVTYGNEQPGLLLHMSDDANTISLKWRNDILDTHHGGLVLLDGTIYGSTMTDNTRGNWASVDWETGKTNWETNWFTKGSVIAADGMLYFYEERRGHVALVKPDTSELKVISTFQVEDGEGPHWAHPSIYNKMLFVRHGSVLLVYDIKA